MCAILDQDHRSGYSDLIFHLVFFQREQKFDILFLTISSTIL